jgi:hypothetical protein
MVIPLASNIALNLRAFAVDSGGTVALIRCRGGSTAMLEDSQERRP